MHDEDFLVVAFERGDVGGCVAAGHKLDFFEGRGALAEPR